MRLLACTFLTEKDVGSSGADGFTKTLPNMLHMIRVSGCGPESRQGIPNELGTIKDDWERGIIQSSLLSQDHDNLWIRLESSLFLVISEYDS